jgi:CysZ protein
MLGSGFGVWRTAPGLMLLGLLPAAIVAIVFAIGIIALGLNLEFLTVAMTQFATDWGEPLRTGVRILIGLTLITVAVLFIVNAFTAVTLVVGQPFYERIWQHVESVGGGIPDAPDVTFLAGLSRALTDGIRMLVPTVFAGIALFALGLVPVAGTILSAALGAVVGGWFLAVELTGQAFESRGKTLTERRRVLRMHRPTVTGFGLATYLVFLIPFGAVLMMPVAVAGAATLSRTLLDSGPEPASGLDRTMS